MGNDGGSIPGRKDLVKDKKKEVKIDKTIKNRPRSQMCSLTKQPLTKPVAFCRLGHLFNYEALLTALRNHKLPSEFDYIYKVKDVKIGNFCSNPDSSSSFPFVCPLSGIELNGSNLFWAIRNCGCVFSDKAFKEVKGSKKECVNCGAKTNPESYVSLNLTIDEQLAIKKKIIEVRLKRKARDGKEDTKHAPSESGYTEVSGVSKKVIVNGIAIKKSLLDKLYDQDSLSFGKTESKLFSLIKITKLSFIRSIKWKQIYFIEM